MKQIFNISILILCSFKASASGISLHIWMTKEAIKLVKDNSFKAFLTCHHEKVYNGAIFPDSGHNSGYGEAAHWPPFLNAYIVYLKEKCRKDNGKITLRGECGHLAAHLLGSLSHMIGDQMFDSKFLTEWEKRKLARSTSAAQQIADEGMDALALWDGRNDIHFDVPTSYAPVNHFVNVFNKTKHKINGKPVSYSDIKCGTNIIWWALVLERWYSLLQYSYYNKVVPQWAKDNYITGPGGVKDSAQEIAKFWDEAWIQITEPEGYQEKSLAKSGSWPNIKVWWEDKNLTK